MINILQNICKYIRVVYYVLLQLIVASLIWTLGVGMLFSLYILLRIKNFIFNKEH